MDQEQLIEMHPQLYHMAELGSWPSIERHGLLSTTALLELFEVDLETRQSLTRHRRPEKVRIEHQELGSAAIRDNKPISDKLLDRCLMGMDKESWYELLNGRVFFWLTKRQLNKFLCARAYRGDTHTVITVSTELLIERQREEIRLSPLNSGAIHPGSLSKRGQGTFSPIDTYDIGLYSRRPRFERIRELAVLHSVPNIPELVIDVEDIRCSG